MLYKVGEVKGLHLLIFGSYNYLYYLCRAKAERCGSSAG